MRSKLKQIIQNGENLTTEFKSSKSKLNKDIYETVCAFLNRDGDGDFNIMGRHSQRADIYHRKEKSYSENEILPYASLDNLRIDLLKKVRIRAKNENSGTHPWMDMDDIFTTTILLLELDEAKTKQDEHPSTIQTRVKTRAKTRVKIIEKIKLNPNITNQALASELELTLKGIEWQMKKLKEEKIIERIGSARSGYWEVTDE